MTCREFIEILIDYLDGELGPEQLATIDGHLAVCPDCVNYLHSYRRTVELEKAAMQEPATDGIEREVPEELVARILGELERTGAPRRRKRR
ncbi:MAG TPA: zf-HC2 domain-containing protein [Candidatus Polarisedimenticolaceae bacterium]|nr:zf-HC2 domain-containing protein [Candidatus Polarisedimenticolaceae bacterium]